MIRSIILSLILCTVAGTGYAQVNCLIYTDSAHKKACELYNRADSFAQGSYKSQLYMDSAIRICPDFSYAWRELGVPYLKRGDFYTWRTYIDMAVALNPADYLIIRGWCRFKFVRDYEGALEDLQYADTLPKYLLPRSGDGYWNIYTMMALCHQQLNNYPQALKYFNLALDSVIVKYGYDQTDMFGYLYRAVLKIQMADYNGALADLELQEKRCNNYVEIPYYRGMAWQGLHQQEKALQQFREAARVYNEGYHFSDPYCEMPCVVYSSDIKEKTEPQEKM